MATHSGVLDWRIYGQRSLVGSSRGCKRVRHDLVTKQLQAPPYFSSLCHKNPPQHCLHLCLQLTPPTLLSHFKESLTSPLLHKAAGQDHQDPPHCPVW